MTINSKIVYIKNKQTFESLINTIPKGLDPLVFIESSKEVWICGTYFSVGYPSINVSESGGNVKISLGDSFFTLSTTGDSLSIRKGEGNNIIISSNALNKINTEAPLDWNTSEKKLYHLDSGVIKGSYGQSSNIENTSIFTIPNITVDSKGHILEIKDRNVEIRDYVEQIASSDINVKRAILLAYTEDENTSASPVRKANDLYYNDAIKRLYIGGGVDINDYVVINNGDLTVSNGYIIGKLKGDVEGEAIPKIHLSETPEYGGASLNLYGHVLLQDNIPETRPDSSSTSSNTGDANIKAIAASPRMVYDVLNNAKEYAKDLLKITDAMLFVGTISGTGVIKSYNSEVIKQTIEIDVTNIFELITYSAGWTFKIVSAGTISGIGKVESGDMIICVNSFNSSYKASDWTAIQANIDGAVSIASNLNPGELIVGDSYTTIKSLQNGSIGQYLSIGEFGLQWVTANSKMRAIKYNGNDFLTEDNFIPLNLKAGNGIVISGLESDGTLTISGTGLLQTYNLEFFNNENLVGTYQPHLANSSLILTGGLKIEKTEENKYSISHSTQYTNKESGLYKIAIDTFGHVSAGDEVTSLVNPSSLKFLNSAGSPVDSYIGNIEKSLKFANGTDISLDVSSSANIITVVPSIIHKYRPISFQDSQSPSATEVFTDTDNGRLTFKAGENISITNSNGILTFKSSYTNSWRDVKAILVGTSSPSVSIGSKTLEFGSDFLWDNSKLQIGWTEIDNNGNMTYVI